MFLRVLLALVGIFANFPEAMRNTEPPPPWATAQIFLTRNELAQRWRSSISTIKRLEASGKLKPIRFGPRRVLYRIEDIQAIEASQAKAI